MFSQSFAPEPADRFEALHSNEWRGETGNLEQQAGVIEEKSLVAFSLLYNFLRERKGL